MRYACFILYLLFICGSSGAQTAPVSSLTDSARTVTFELLPRYKVIPVFTADARSHRLQLLKDLNSKGFIGSMGGQFPVFNVNALRKTLQFSVAATVYTTLNRYVGRGRVVNVDYFVDFLFDLELKPNWALRGGLGHTSQHLSDDAIESGLTPQNYAKDYVQLQTVHKLLRQRLMVYGGVYYFDNFKVTNQGVAKDLSGNVMLQAGFEADAFRLSPITAIYVGGHVKFRQEFDFGTTHTVQSGIKFTPGSGRVMRFAYQFQGGYEERGQFYTNQINLQTVGLYFDF